MHLGKADVTVHIDEYLDAPHRQEIRGSLRGMNGVVDVLNPDNTPHLMVVAYDPEFLNSGDILRHVTCRGLHAELIGL